MKDYVNIIELFRKNPEMPCFLQASDLLNMAHQLVEEVREEYERQQNVKDLEKREEYLSPETVMSICHISRATLYRLRKAKLLFPVMVGGQLRYRRQDLTDYLNR